MLKGIPAILPPQLLAILMEMGHGDELLLCDGNYPRMGHPPRLVRCDGHGLPQLLEAILQLMPLDSYVENPAKLMAVVPGDDVVPVIWEEYRRIAQKHEPAGLRDICLDRHTFYQHGAGAYAAVATGESALYANIILRKGVIRPA